MFKVGDKIRLKDYSLYSDYERHNGQIATIIENYSGIDFDHEIQWVNDGDSSAAHTNNMILVTEGKNRYDYLFKGAS